MKILSIVYGMLTTYQKSLNPVEPDPSVAKVITAIEQAARPPEPHGCMYYWWDCPVFRRVEALEMCFKQYTKEGGVR